MKFESFLKSLRDTLHQVIRTDLPPGKSLSAVWESTEQLAWIGLTQEQESFYISYSFGKLVNADSFAGHNMSTQRFDYLEQYRINKDHYPKVGVTGIKRVFSDLLADDIDVDASEDVDEDELSDLRDEMVRLAVLTALGIFAIELMRQPEKLPISVRKDFSVSVSGDRETPTWACRIPAVSGISPKTRRLMVARLCSTEQCRRIFMELLKHGDSGKTVDLLKTLQKAVAVSK